MQSGVALKFGALTTPKRNGHNRKSSFLLLQELRVPFGVTSLKFGAQCPRLENVQLLAYLGDSVRLDSTSFPAIKTLQIEMPKVNLEAALLTSSLL